MKNILCFDSFKNLWRYHLIVLDRNCNNKWLAKEFQLSISNFKHKIRILSTKYLEVFPYIIHEYLRFEKNQCGSFRYDGQIEISVLLLVLKFGCWSCLRI